MSEEPCELYHIRDRLLEVYQEHEMKEDGATASMEELCRFPLFNRCSRLRVLPEELDHQAAAKLPEDSRTIVVIYFWMRWINTSIAWSCRKQPDARGLAHHLHDR